MPAAQAAGTLDSKHSGLIRFLAEARNMSLSTVETTAGEPRSRGPKRTAVAGKMGGKPIQYLD